MKRAVGFLGRYEMPTRVLAQYAVVTIHTENKDEYTLSTQHI